MESISPSTANQSQQSLGAAIELSTPFSQEWVSITKEEYIELSHQANYWKAQHAQIKRKCAELEDACQYKDAKIKDLHPSLSVALHFRSKKGLISPKIA